MKYYLCDLGSDRNDYLDLICQWLPRSIDARNFSSHPDWTLRVCDNFDWYAPRYQSHHTTQELKDWFREEGFADLAELDPAKGGRLYDWTYRHNLIIGSGVNVAGRRGS